MEWQDYQNKVQLYFQELGYHAKTDVTIQGVRTNHDIDVLVKLNFIGFDITWIIECKHWKSKVSKLHVLALREIVNDIGADRGIILAENGFQKGAYEAATLTNIHISNLKEVIEKSSNEIYSMKLREISERINSAREILRKISKLKRIELGLRPEVLQIGYSSTHTLRIAEDFIYKGFLGTFPCYVDETTQVLSERVTDTQFPTQFNNLKEIIEILEKIISNLELKISNSITNLST